MKESIIKFLFFNFLYLGEHRTQAIGKDRQVRAFGLVLRVGWFRGA